MPYYSEMDFLEKGIQPSATHKPGCDICYEVFPVPKSQRRLSAYLRNPCSTTKAILSRLYNMRRSSSYASKDCNRMIEIINCGHKLCWKCLTRWLLEKNTCPMCRDVLFYQDTWSEHRSDSDQPMDSSRPLLELRDMGVPFAGMLALEEIDLEVEIEEEQIYMWAYELQGPYRQLGRQESLRANFRVIQTRRNGMPSVGAENSFEEGSQWGLNEEGAQGEEEMEEAKEAENLINFDDDEQTLVEEFSRLYLYVSSQVDGDEIASVA